MENLDLNKLTSEELDDLHCRVTRILNERKHDAEVKRMSQEIDSKGYCFSLNIFYEFPCLELSLNVDISTYDKEDHTDIHARGLSYDQLPLIKRLGFNYHPTDKDDYDYDDDDWTSGDWDDPDKNIGKMSLFLYYKKVPCPPEGTRFESSDETGEIKQTEIRDGQIYREGESDWPVTMWDEIELFVLPKM